ncbi:MAG: carotenoid oxygenase family protein [Allosphingosinicella sp.]
MTAFPKTLQFSGLNTPIRVEWEARDLEVEGEIPADVEGAFFRAVPDPAHPPMFEDDNYLSGDGMVSRFLFKDGKVDHAIKYVRTARYEAERKARRALFGRYRNLYTDRPEVQGVDRTLANTTPVWHAGRLFMTKEDGRAYEVDPDTLETIDQWDFHGALRSQTMTAHVRVDPDTKEMFFFGYEASGPCSKDVAYCIADAAGNLVSEQWFEVPYCALMHDFAITEHHAIFPVFPTVADLDRLKAGGDHWMHDPELDSWIGIMPRYGKVEEMRWFKGPKGVSSFHFMNAFEEDGRIHLDFGVSSTNGFPFIHVTSGTKPPMMERRSGLVRWTMDMSRNSDEIEQRPLGPPGDMPRIPEAVQGRPYRIGYYCSVNPQGGPPLVGGPVEAMFNCLFRIDHATGKLDVMGLPPQMSISEPVHIPTRDPDREGWLMFVVDRAISENVFESEVWIVDAGNVAAGAVARVKVPVQLRAQVHGWWVPAEELERAVARQRA